MTDKEGRHVWNKEAINKMIIDLAANWQNLTVTFQSDLELKVEYAESLMNQAIDRLGTFW